MEVVQKCEAIRKRCLEVNPTMTGEPHLADILLAANAVRPQLRLNCSATGRFGVWNDRTQSYSPGGIWHLRLDALDQQSSGTIDFVYDLLCGHS